MSLATLLNDGKPIRVINLGEQTQDFDVKNHSALNEILSNEDLTGVDLVGWGDFNKGVAGGITISKIPVADRAGYVPEASEPNFTYGNLKIRWYNDILGGNNALFIYSISYRGYGIYSQSFGVQNISSGAYASWRGDENGWFRGFVFFVVWSVNGQYKLCNAAVRYSNPDMFTTKPNIGGAPSRLKSYKKEGATYIFNLRTTGGYIYRVAKDDISDTIQPDPKPDTAPIAGLFFNKSEKNKVDKELEDKGQYRVTLNSPTDLMNPVIDIMAENADYLIKNVNYVYMSAFERWYFVTSIEILRTNLIRIRCRVDVLYSFREQIKKQKAIIARNEENYNLLLDDQNFEFQANPVIKTKRFPNNKVFLNNNSRVEQHFVLVLV